MTITVLLVDDHPVVRAGLRAVIDSHPDVSVIGESSTGEEAVATARQTHPDVVLCDLRLGEGMDGIATTTALRQLDPAPTVVILTTFDRDAEVVGAIEAGASGYVLKDQSPDAIVEGVRRAARGDMVLSPELTTRVMRGMRSPATRLTDRELDVLRLLATGSSNKEIAKSLFVTEATVKSHLVHIFSKLGVDNRARAIRVGQDSGLI